MDGSVSTETSPEELQGSEERKEVVEERSGAYWTTLAPNVEDYSGSFARWIAAGSGQVVRGKMESHEDNTSGDFNFFSVSLTFGNSIRAVGGKTEGEGIIHSEIVIISVDLEKETSRSLFVFWSLMFLHR